jgi:hypothetical protein
MPGATWPTEVSRKELNELSREGILSKGVAMAWRFIVFLLAGNRGQREVSRNF